MAATRNDISDYSDGDSIFNELHNALVKGGNRVRSIVRWVDQLSTSQGRTNRIHRPPTPYFRSTEPEALTVACPGLGDVSWFDDTMSASAYSDRSGEEDIIVFAGRVKPRRPRLNDGIVSPNKVVNCFTPDLPSPWDALTLQTFCSSDTPRRQKRRPPPLQLNPRHLIRADGYSWIEVYVETPSPCATRRVDDHLLALWRLNGYDIMCWHRGMMLVHEELCGKIPVDTSGPYAMRAGPPKLALPVGLEPDYSCGWPVEEIMCQGISRDLRLPAVVDRVFWPSLMRNGDWDKVNSQWRLFEVQNELCEYFYT